MVLYTVFLIWIFPGGAKAWRKRECPPRYLLLCTFISCNAYPIPFNYRNYKFGERKIKASDLYKENLGLSCQRSAFVGCEVLLQLLHFVGGVIGIQVTLPSMGHHCTKRQQQVSRTPFCIYIFTESRTQHSLCWVSELWRDLADGDWSSSGSANPCWVGGGSA